MRAPSISIALLGLALSLPASAATVLFPELSGATDPQEGNRARAGLLRALGAYPDIKIAPLSKFKKLAKRHKLDPRQLATSHAAFVLGRYEGLDGLLVGSLSTKDRLRVVQVVLYDPTGATVFKSEIPVTEGSLSASAADSAATSIAAALGIIEPAKPAPQPTEPNHPPETEPTPKPAETGEPPPTEGHASETTSEKPTAKPEPESTETTAAPEEPVAGEPTFKIGLSVPLSWRFFQLSDQSLSPPTYLAFSTGVPYTGAALDLSLFPFKAPSGLRGLGVLGGFSIGFLNATALGATFSAQDIRGNVDLTYRLRASGSAFSPSFGVRAGYGLFHFAVDPTNPAGLVNLNRSCLEIGLDYIQDLGRYFRIGLGGTLYTLATPGALEEAEYGVSTSLGYGANVALMGLFGKSGLGYQIKADFISFGDEFTGQGTVQGVTGSAEMFIDTQVGLTYSF